MKRKTPLRRSKMQHPGEESPKPTKSLRRQRRVRQRAFSEIHDGTGERYGPAFQAVRSMPCYLATVGYFGPKHERCGHGLQGGHTAHHFGRLDADGMLPGCGLAHDLYARIAGRIPQMELDAWLEERGIDLRAEARRIASGASPLDMDL